MISTSKTKMLTQFPFTPQSLYLSLSLSEVCELQLPPLFFFFFFFFLKKQGNRNPQNELNVSHNDGVNWRNYLCTDLACRQFQLRFLSPLNHRSFLPPRIQETPFRQCYRKDLDDLQKAWRIFSNDFSFYFGASSLAILRFLKRQLKHSIN